MINKSAGYRIVLINLALAGAYFLLGKFCLWFAASSSHVAYVWLPSGLALAALLLGGSRYAFGILVGAFITTMTIAVSAGIALASTLQALLGWWLLTRYVKLDVKFNKLGDFLLILFAVAPLSAGLGTTIGISSLLAGGIIPLGQWQNSALNWWMADVLGIILVTPLVVAWRTPWSINFSAFDITKTLRAALALVLTFLAGQIIFLGWFADCFGFVAKAYLMFFFVSWIAIDLRLKGVTAVLLMITTQILLGASKGIGYFGNDFVHAQLVEFWIFIFTLSIVGMVFAIYIAEHKQVGAALQESETRFQQLFQDIPFVAVLIYNEKGIIQYWNNAAEQLYGYSSQEVIGRDIVKLLFPIVERDKYKHAIRKMFATAKPIPLSELTLLNKTGSKIDVIAYHVYAARETPEAFCITINITEQKHTERILRQHEQELRTLFNSIPDLIWLKNREGAYLFCNTAFERFLGAKTNEIIGKTDFDFVGHQHANFFHDSDVKTIADGVPRISEESIVFADNHHRARLEILKAPMYGNDGNLVGVLGVARDITKRDNTEKPLPLNEAQLQAIIDISPVPMVLSDQHHHFVALNPAFERILGYNASDLHNINDWWIKACPDSDYRRLAINIWQSALEHAIKHQQNIPPIEFGITCKSGEVKTLLISASPLDKNFSGYYLVVFDDISNQKHITETALNNEALLRKKDGYQRALLDNFPFSVWLKDTNSHFLAVNQAFANSIGVATPDAVTGKSDVDFYLPEVAQQYQQEDFSVLETRQKRMFEEERIDPMGVSYWIEIYKAPVIAESGELLGSVGFARDITERKRNETDLRIAATAFESQDGMFITDANRIILRVNRAFTAITGYSPEDVIGQTPMLFNSYHQDESFYAELWDCIFDVGAWQGEIWTQRKNGDVYLVWLMVTPVKDIRNNITHYVTALTDITVRKEAEEQIKQFAFYDSLTHLPNRRKLLEHLAHCIAVSVREKTQFAVLMLDLDRFKAVNDHFGHTAGDELLQQVAERISNRMRGTDTVARLGGDEFVVLLSDISRKQDAARVAEMIVEDITMPFNLSQHGEVQIGTSIGISLYPEHGESAEMLLDNADVALYQAKNNGRGCFAYFSESLTLATRQRLQIEAKLRRGLEQQELRVLYQPKIDIATGKIIGAEALVRWQDFNELMLPSYFIPIAEETSLIIDIGAWVLYETCHQGQMWLAEGLPPITLAVNIAPSQIKRGDIMALVCQVLDDTNFPANYLELEITERGLSESQEIEAIVDILNNLHRLGIQLSIDNFGTGYSSLIHLERFPIDTLKIDRSFISTIIDSQQNTGIASTVIAMAHSLGFKVLAEGVETNEQLEFLRAKQCDFYQGYIKSKPITANEFAALLRAQNAM